MCLSLRRWPLAPSFERFRLVWFWIRSRVVAAESEDVISLGRSSLLAPLARIRLVDFALRSAAKSPGPSLHHFHLIKQ